MQDEIVAMTDFAARSRDVAEKFLQSAIVVDDHAWMEDTQTPFPIAGSLVAPSYETSAAVGEQGENTIEDVGLNAEAVTNGFAKFGIVCAVLNPNEVEQIEQDYFDPNIARAAARSDIVVLDWKIRQFIRGEATLRILRDILQMDKYASKLRLFAIYTGEPDLAAISDRVKETLRDLQPQSNISGETLRIRQGPISVVIIAKEGVGDAIAPEFSDQVVNESELPNKLVEEFARTTGGLLRNAALAGLTALREGAHQLLAKFDTHLDPAYLGHRMLLPNPSDSEDHVVEALSSELLSILEDRRIGSAAGTEAIREWLTNEESIALDLGSPVAIPNNSSGLATWMKLLDKGRNNDIKRELNISGSDWTELWEKLGNDATHIFSRDETFADQANRHFAILLGLRSRYSNQQAPRLTLGTILVVENDGETEYFLCLQPKCDSVRLKRTTGFPLLPLKVLSNPSRSTKFSLVIQRDSGQWVYLDYVPKPRNLIVRQFDPSPYPPGEVAACDCGSSPYFKDTLGKVYSLVAEMKDEQALRVAGEMATAISRPGANDSEWLRLASPRR